MEDSRPSPILTITTDFGLADHYVGTMKGVILSRCANARIVDISHEIAAFSVWMGAYTIDQAAPFFPPQTTHLVVIDPGVGTARRAILVEALGQRFIAPDNGVLSMIFRRDPNARVRELSNRRLFLPEPSSTFHGRDIFAPVAAALAAGSVGAEDVGPLVTDPQILNRLDPVDSSPFLKTGAILSVDRFGNVITNFKAPRTMPLVSDQFEIRTLHHKITIFCPTFEEAPPELCFAYIGSSGNIELGMNRRSAAQFLNVSPGDVLEFENRLQAEGE